MKHDSTIDTLNHKRRVNQLLIMATNELLLRAVNHDNSKLEYPEKYLFDEYTPQLAKCTYNSDDYNEFLIKLKPALDHHYAHNSHHPEHYKNGVNDFDLFDLIEMFFDWKASAERQHNGNIHKSIEANAKRFNMTNQLEEIFTNTAKRIKF